MRRGWLVLLAIFALIVFVGGCNIPNPGSNDGGDIQAEGFAPPVAATAGVVQEAPAASSETGAAIAQTEVATISVLPTAQQLAAGELGIVQIRVNNVTDLFGLEIGLQFDPLVIEIQDSDTGQEGAQIQPGDFLSPDLIQTNQADNVAGLISYVVTQQAPSPPVSGDGVIATVNFRAIAAGTTDINFTVVKLSTPDGLQISATIEPGRVTVIESGQPTATFTLTPSPTSTGDTPVPTSTFTPTPTPTVMVVTVTPTFTPTPLPLPPTNTPVPPNMVIPPGATVGFCYRVQLCETLACVARKFGVDPHYLSLVNDLHPPGHIFTHQALFIPETPGRGPNVYIVKEGDTLPLIADACHLPSDFLAWANCLEQDAVLQAGHVLEIPIPPFPPPSRYPYPPPGPPSVAPPVGRPPGGCAPYGSY